MKSLTFFMAVILALTMVIPVAGCPEKLSAEDYNRRGMSLAEQGKYEDAITDYTRAIEIDPGKADYYVNRGIAYLNMKQFDLAIADFDKAIELDPTLAIAYANRGCAYASKGLLDLAISDFKKTIELSKNAELTAYAKKMLENLTKIPPLIAIIPLPPLIIIYQETPPVDETDNTKISKGSQATEDWWPEAVGKWHGTLEIIAATDTDIEKYDMHVAGDFYFDIAENEYFRGTGSGTFSGTIHRKWMDEGYWKESNGSINSEYSLDVEYNHEDYNHRYSLDELGIRHIRVRINIHDDDLVPNTFTLTVDDNKDVYQRQREILIYIPLNKFNPPTLELEDGATFETTYESWSGSPTLKVKIINKLR